MKRLAPIIRFDQDFGWTKCGVPNFIQLDPGVCSLQWSHTYEKNSFHHLRYTFSLALTQIYRHIKVHSISSLTLHLHAIQYPYISTMLDQLIKTLRKNLVAIHLVSLEIITHILIRLLNYYKLLHRAVFILCRKYNTKAIH